jgi:hypothetical protein
LLSLRDLAAQDEIGKAEQRNALLLCDCCDFLRVLLSRSKVIKAERNPAENHETEHPSGRNRERFKPLPGLCRERVRFPVALELKVDVRSIEVEHGNPVSVAFTLKCLLRRTKGFEGFCEPTHLHESDAVEGEGFRFLVDHSNLFELPARTLSERGRIAGDVELEIDLRLIEVAETKVHQASRIPEVRPNPCERLECFAVTTPEEEKIRSVVARLDTQFLHTKRSSELLGSYIHRVRLFESIEAAERISEILVDECGRPLIAGGFENLECLGVVVAGSLVLV